MKKIRPLDLRNVRRYPLSGRKSKVDISDFSKSWSKGGSFRQWIETLPRILAARELLEVRDRIIKAYRDKRPIILGMGAHPIKVGLSPIIIDLMERGIITAIATNGASIVHDAEIAMIGKTSEDVGEQLRDGRFGLSEETGHFLNQAIRWGAERDMGLGQAIGKKIAESDFPFKDLSIFSNSVRLNIPITVHVAIGTDIIHIHPEVDGASIGKCSHRDFLIFSKLISDLDGGVFINLGSAVIIPEVFLKALSLVRNLGYRVKDITTLTMDFIRQYRAMHNVVSRPTLEGGKGYYIVGHHEIMFPLLYASLIEAFGENEL